VVLASLAADGINHLSGVVCEAFVEGPMVRLVIECGARLTALALSPEARGLRPGDRVTVGVAPEDVHCLAAGAPSA
jgi:hypothetical protein